MAAYGIILTIVALLPRQRLNSPSFLYEEIRKLNAAFEEKVFWDI